jgi:hypothetical protein
MLSTSCHRLSGGQNVFAGVLVSVQMFAAVFAIELTHFQAELGVNMSARETAFARRIESVRNTQLPTVPRALVFQHPAEHPKAGATDMLGKLPVFNLYFCGIMPHIVRYEKATSFRCGIGNLAGRENERRDCSFVWDELQRGFYAKKTIADSVQGESEDVLLLRSLISVCVFPPRLFQNRRDVHLLQGVPSEKEQKISPQARGEISRPFKVEIRNQPGSMSEKRSGILSREQREGVGEEDSAGLRNRRNSVQSHAEIARWQMCNLPHFGGTKDCQKTVYRPLPQNGQGEGNTLWELQLSIGLCKGQVRDTSKCSGLFRQRKIVGVSSTAELPRQLRFLAVARIHPESFPNFHKRNVVHVKQSVNT